MDPEGVITSSRPPEAAGTISWSTWIGAVQVRFGAGEIVRLPDLVTRHGGSRVLVVTDAGVREACDVDAWTERVGETVGAAWVFDEVDENPTGATVDAAAAFAAERDVDLIVGFGGGSAMDTAKGVNFLLSHGGRMRDHRGSDRVPGPMLPSIGVPTTAGTGSEAQRFALISDDDSHEKMACGAEGARFRAVVLDPELTTTVPREVAVATGIDAISHAVESRVTRVRTPVSTMLATEAWRRLAGNLVPSMEAPEDLRARAEMLLGAHLAGAAIEASMLGAAHACANPLTARLEITHGIAVGAMLPAVIRYNETAVGHLYAELAAAGPDGPAVPLVAQIERLREATGESFRLGDLGVERGLVPELARDAAEQWTAGFNPRPVTVERLEAVYEDAL